jgi:competence protein ComFB
MDIKVKNVVEDVVLEIFNETKGGLDCCLCDQCSSDIVAYALNRIPPKYVSTEKGALYSKTTASFDQMYRMEVLKAIAEGSRVVKEHPRH